MADILESVTGVADFVGYILVFLLTGAGIYFCIRTRGVQIRRIADSIRSVFGKNARTGSDGNKISSFHAFCIGVGTRVGIGNITGVAVALTTGGPGAIFWMWLLAVIGAATSFIETTLGQIYKEKSANGGFVGGLFFTIKNALKKPKFAAGVAILSLLTYGICTSGTFGSTVTTSIVDLTGLPVWAVALGICLLLGIIVIGGIKRVAKVSNVVVPIMAGAYILLAVIVVCCNITELPGVIALIFTEAFSLEAGIGGLLGGAILVGVQRGLFSNEAGDGSMVMISSAADVAHPARQGLVQTFGVFIDTLVICSATAFMILVGGEALGVNGENISMISSLSSSGAMGMAVAIVLTVFIFVFAITSMMGTFSMGEMSLRFLTKNERIITLAKIGILILVFILSITTMDIVWKLNDIAMGVHTIVNVIVILILAKYALEALRDFEKQRKAGVEEPVFTKDALSNPDGVTVWEKK